MAGSDLLSAELFSDRLSSTFFNVLHVEERWSENNSADNKSEPAKHLADNEEHSFLWSILFVAPKDGRRRKNLEAFFIVKLKPPFDRQEDSNMLTLFRNSVT